MLQKSETVSEIAKAVLAVQGQLKPAVKDSRNPFYKSTYADLNSCWDAIRELLQANGLVVIQMPGTSGDMRPTLTTLLLHTSGEYFMDEAILLIDKPNAQGYGSAVTYYRRYGLSAVIGLISDDDDGAAASGTTGTPPAKETKATAKATSKRLEQAPTLEQAQSTATARAKAEVEKQGEEIMTEQAWGAVKKELEQFNLNDTEFHHWAVKSLQNKHMVVPENMAALTKTAGGYLWTLANASKKAGELLYTV